MAVLVLLLLLSGKIVHPIAESYEKQKQFITDAGHELKTPITVIRADADVLESELEQEGLVQRFEYTFELSWKVMQDLLIFKGYEFMLGPNGTLKMAFEDGLISDHDGWRQMTKSRNMLSHVYDEEEADAIVRLIFSRYAPLLKSLDEKLDQLSKDKDYLQS